MSLSLLIFCPASTMTLWPKDRRVSGSPLCPLRIKIPPSISTLGPQGEKTPSCPQLPMWALVLLPSGGGCNTQDDSGQEPVLWGQGWYMTEQGVGAPGESVGEDDSLGAGAQALTERLGPLGLDKALPLSLGFPLSTQGGPRAPRRHALKPGQSLPRSLFCY